MSETLSVREEIAADIEARLARMKRQEEIRCPHCETVFVDDEYQHVSYHGSEDGAKECCCNDCGVTFFVHEMVRRTFWTGRTPDEARQGGYDAR